MLDQAETAGNRIGAEQWREVVTRIAALIDGETDTIAKMATIACELFHAFDHFDWVGFYRHVGNETLKIGPYQGGHGCLTIPFSRGVCGAAARTGEIQRIGDVDAIADHIACSPTTRSELVLPVFQGAELIAVLDIDSDHRDAFSKTDETALAEILEASFKTG